METRAPIQDISNTPCFARRVSKEEYDRQTVNLTTKMIEDLNEEVRKNPEIAKGSKFFQDENNILKGLPCFQGKHTRFDDDGTGTDVTKTFTSDEAVTPTPCDPEGKINDSCNNSGEHLSSCGVMSEDDEYEIHESWSEEGQAPETVTEFDDYLLDEEGKDMVDEEEAALIGSLTNCVVDDDKKNTHLRFSESDSED